MDQHKRRPIVWTEHRVIAVARAVVAELDFLTCPTEDGGVTIEIEHENARSLTFVLPDNGSRCYFAAVDGPAVLTGIVSHHAGIQGLARWVHGDHDYIPGQGLVLPWGA